MRRWRWAPLSSGRAMSAPVQALQPVERLRRRVLLDPRAFEVEQQPVLAVAQRAPHVLLDQAAREVGRRLARVDLAQRLGDAGHDQLDQAVGLGAGGLRVADADLDRPEGVVRAHRPPELGELDDRVGVAAAGAT